MCVFDEETDKDMDFLLHENGIFSLNNNKQMLKENTSCRIDRCFELIPHTHTTEFKNNYHSTKLLYNPTTKIITIIHSDLQVVQRNI